ncbi:hypothetical protein BDY17DRAFT_309156 [Neohortaea acidophila]|uniref:F-box domain-containing protein n=1 Tax=Neohortaea acidophila TaxID=245834 RepID=A0A6A6Q361_9PEZI|nr:uncharacterized protein BDY17DRAFT_309156 [Neohortaea acidophila]KAF2485867.1 hypothetical protein BDY17DRAFT_309156 [Neohortaea acidophila]
MASTIIVARQPQVQALSVFRIGELCDLVVDQLRALDVLRVSRVSKELAVIIQGSKSAQKKLFLLADHKGDINAPTVNTKLFHAIRGKFITRIPGVSPLHEPRQRTLGIGDKEKLCAFPYSSMTCLSFRLTSPVDKSSSCSDMFLTQPPVTTATLSICTARRDEPGSGRWGEKILKDVGGIKFKHVAAAIAEHRATLKDEEYLDPVMTHVELYHLPYDPDCFKYLGLSSARAVKRMMGRRREA